LGDRKGKKPVPVIPTVHFSNKWRKKSRETGQPRFTGKTAVKMDEVVGRTNSNKSVGVSAQFSKHFKQ